MDSFIRVHAINIILFGFMFSGCVEIPPAPETPATGEWVETTADTSSAPASDVCYIVGHVSDDGENAAGYTIELYIRHSGYSKAQTTYTIETNTVGNYTWIVTWEDVDHHEYQLRIYDYWERQFQEFTGRIRFGEKYRHNAAW